MAESCCQPKSASSAALGSSGIAVPDLPPPVPACPQCGHQGKPVDQQLVKSMLAVSLRLVVADEYFFCRTEGCPVVYYSRDGASVFNEGDVREVVYQKHPHDPETPICYCFRHKVKDLTQASFREAEQVLADIRAGIAADQCACDIRNPQGSCCLGNVTMAARVSRPPDR